MRVRGRYICVCLYGGGSRGQKPLSPSGIAGVISGVTGVCEALALMLRTELALVKNSKFLNY